MEWRMWETGLDRLESDKTWGKLYGLLGPTNRSPYFSPQFFRAYSEIEKESPECFWMYKDEYNFIFYPYIRKSINHLGYELDNQYYDLSGAYGYNGPIGEVLDKELILEFNKALKNYLAKTNIVTEFVRYCPIPSNKQFHTYTQQVDVLDNVYLDLGKGIDWIWGESFKSGVKKAVNRGKAFGLKTVSIEAHEASDKEITQFYEIYLSTMSRNRADAFYSFPMDYFKSLFTNMQGRLLLYITYHDNQPTTTETVLLDGNLAYGFLGGTLSEYYEYKVNSFQRWEIIQDLIGKGITTYSLGGSAVRGDGIYQFKKSFAPECNNPFFIGTYIHNESVYQEVQDQFKTKNSLSYEVNKAKLQGYRLIHQEQGS